MAEKFASDAELDNREEAIKKRLDRIRKLEEEVIQKEKALKKKEKAKKQILLRLAPSLWEDLAAWAEEDYRSINSQIEFLLADCVRKRKNGRKSTD